MAVRFLVMGGFTIDTLSFWDQRQERVVCGGSALYAAVGAAIWADDADEIGLVGCIGATYPRAWLEAIRATGLDLQGVRELDQDHALLFRARYDRRGHRRWLADSPSVRRARVAFLPAADHLPAAYRRAEAALCCQSDLAHQSRQCATLHRLGLRVFLDPDERQGADLSPETLPDFLAAVDVLLPSEEEVPEYLAGYLAGQPERIARELGRFGPRVVALKLGGRGSVVYDGVSGATHVVPTLPVRVVDPTGAGDAYCGGFMVALARTGDPLEAARCATVSASLVIEGWGILPALQEIAAVRREGPARLAALRSMEDG